MLFEVGDLIWVSFYNKVLVLSVLDTHEEICCVKRASDEADTWIHPCEIFGFYRGLRNDTT